MDYPKDTQFYCPNCKEPSFKLKEDFVEERDIYISRGMCYDNEFHGMCLKCGCNETSITEDGKVMDDGLWKDEINGVKFEWSGECFDVKGRGTVYPVKLIGMYNHALISKALIGEEYKGREIIAVEMFAVEDPLNRSIGIVVGDIE